MRANKVPIFLECNGISLKNFASSFSTNAIRRWEDYPQSSCKGFAEEKSLYRTTLSYIFLGTLLRWFVTKGKLDWVMKSGINIQLPRPHPCKTKGEPSVA